MRNLFVNIALLVSFALTGCTITAGGRPMLGVETEKDKEGKPAPLFGTNITVHEYGTSVQPQPSPPGTPPTPPVLQKSGVAVLPQPVSYKTVYPSKWDDPTLIVIQNQSPRFVRVKIDGAKEEIRLAPYQPTTDLNFDVGEHRLRVIIEKPTASFGIKTTERIIPVVIRPDGRSQIISIYDY